MKILHTISDFRAWRHDLPRAATTPFVPTMGALHEGHAFLVRQARQMTPATGVIASIFVNPTQFGPAEDFAKYPRTLDADCQLLAAAGCDALFVPTAAEMYGKSQNLNAATQFDAGITIDPGPLGDTLEGAIRPGHFRGVCTVVAKLLNIVQPTHLLLGQKDFQQQAILRHMCQDLNLPVEVLTCPTLREPDGLAMSSRNRYLNPDERTRAIALFQALTWAKKSFDSGQRDARILDAGMEERLRARNLEPQYAHACSAHTLQPFQDDGNLIHSPAVLLLAAKLGPTRLIDNMLL